MPANKLSGLSLKTNERAALNELKVRLENKFPGCELVLFGSRSRGKGDEFSDLDVLIILDTKIDRMLHEMITDISYPLELEFNVVFGKIIESRADWDSPISRITPLHRNIDREGVRV
jgi:predicted nucleotidyltransferase